MARRNPQNEDPKDEAPRMTIGKKLTLKALIGGPSAMRDACHGQGPKGRLIARVVGICTGTKETKTTMPDGKVSTSIGLLGEFTGTDLLDGEQLYAPVCYLPEPVPGMVAASLASEHVVRVEVAVEIKVIEDESSVTGYVYAVSPLKEFSPSEELLALTATLGV